jgi:two-component sensor histidine kinase
MALIMSELFVNGVKYTPTRQDNQALQLIVREEGGVGRVTLFCRSAHLPEGFDFRQGKGLGTGLDLVKALLPRVGAQLTLTNQPDGVLSELQLREPVVTPGLLPPTPLSNS